MTPKLSICIPTYNRSGCLKECLNSILISISGYEDQIEIVISDNASTDDTADIIHSFQTKYPWFRCYRNVENIGPSHNIYRVATLGHGEYIWIFGDDDKMAKEAVASVIKQIDSGYNLIICNYSVWAKDFSYIKKTSGFQLDNDEFFKDPNELLKHIGYFIGYISIIIMKRDVLFKATHSEYMRYIDYYFPHLFATYSGLLAHCNAIYISSTLVNNRSDNHRGVTWSDAYVVGLSLIFQGLLNKGYSKSAIYSAKNNLLCNILIYGVIGSKANNLHLPDNINKLMYTHYKKHWIFWVVLIPILLTPAIAFRFAKKTIMAFISKTKPEEA